MKIKKSNGEFYEYNYNFVGFVIKNRELYRFLKRSAKLQNRTISNYLVNLIKEKFNGELNV